MKMILAALAAIVATTSFAAPAMAGPREAGGLYVEVRDGDWGRHGGWGDDRRGGGWDRGGDDILSERRVVRRLLRDGYVRVDDIDLRRDRYIVRAVRPNGAVVRLAIDAYDGAVLARERIGWDDEGRRFEGRPAYRQPTSSGIEFDLGTGRVSVYER